MTHLPGVNVIGPLCDESGVGEAARAVVAALDAVGVPVLPALAPLEAVSRQSVRFRVTSVDRAVFPVTILCLTPVETMAFFDRVGPAWRAGRHTIGFWWWEVLPLPADLHPAFACVDEVWAGLGHVASAFAPPAADVGVPVTQVRVPVRRAIETTLRRHDVGLPAGFTFLTVFGYYSSIARKNPLGAIEAFSQAFAPGEGPSLVVKCIDEQTHPREHAAVCAAAARHPDVYILDGYRTRAEMDALVQLCDVVVSLHRAEGFGFSLAEGMRQGKPVIATDYSGNLDFMSAENALLVPAKEVVIGLDSGPYPSDGVWAEPDLVAAAATMRMIADNPAVGERIGARAARDIAERHSARVVGTLMQSALDGHGDDHRWRRARWRAQRLRRGRGVES